MNSVDFYLDIKSSYTVSAHTPDPLVTTFLVLLAYVLFITTITTVSSVLLLFCIPLYYTRV